MITSQDNHLHPMIRMFCFLIALDMLAGCGWLGSRSKPTWVDGPSREYPHSQYLVGLGAADNRNAASEQAYAAVAKIFKAEINAQARDWESYLVIENRGQASTERRLTLDNVTRVSTDKVLENVQILDTWLDRARNQHYALAGMNRAQAESAMMERIAELDRLVETQVSEARQTQDKLTRVRNLKRAAKNLVLREAYNADLRVIRTSGQGTASAYRVAELTAELEQFLASNLAIAVEITGDQAEPIQRAVTEGLIREGLPVTDRRGGADTMINTGDGGPAPELLVKGTVRLWPIDVKDPQFKYVRWCSDFVIQELSTQRIVGVVAKGGKEGHLTNREATAKAVRIMQQEFTSDLAKQIAGHVYGDTELPTAVNHSAGCPRGEGP
ncbi:MAG: LPP20 family lipoprotein [Nitrospiraceae bacterium]